MPTLNELIEFQKRFDKDHGLDWSDLSEEQKIEKLSRIAVALSGEIGEFCNLVKKVLREYDRTGKLPDEDMNEKLREELTDIFIYILKAAGQLLGMDLEKWYFEKMNYNARRFEKYKTS